MDLRLDELRAFEGMGVRKITNMSVSAFFQKLRSTKHLPVTEMNANDLLRFSWNN